MCAAESYDKRASFFDPRSPRSQGRGIAVSHGRRVPNPWRSRAVFDGPVYVGSSRRCLRFVLQLVPRVSRSTRSGFRRGLDRVLRSWLTLLLLRELRAAARGRDAVRGLDPPDTCDGRCRGRLRRADIGGRARRLARRHALPDLAGPGRDRFHPRYPPGHVDRPGYAPLAPHVLQGPFRAPREATPNPPPIAADLALSVSVVLALAVAGLWVSRSIDASSAQEGSVALTGRIQSTGVPRNGLVRATVELTVENDRPRPNGWPAADRDRAGGPGDGPDRAAVIVSPNSTTRVAVPVRVPCGGAVRATLSNPRGARRVVRLRVGCRTRG